MEYHVVIDISIGAHKKVDLVLKNKSLKKSKVVIGIWYASGGKKFNLQIRKKNGSFQSRFLYLNISLIYFTKSKRS